MSGDFERHRDTAAADKGLQIAMAIKRWVRDLPDAQIGNGGYIASRDIQAAIEGDGLEVRTKVNLTQDGLPRIQAGVGSAGFDENLIIESMGDDRYMIKMKKNAVE